MYKSLKNTKENIKVIVRIKPNSEESISFINHDSKENSVTIVNREKFTFDKVAGGNVSQDAMFASCKDTFQSFVDGYNATIFAYGQTGSGKTFTMTGECDITGNMENAGITPRGLSLIFNKTKEREVLDNLQFLIKCSFVEIYNEEIYDLLDINQQKLTLHFNISNEVFLQPCTEITIDNPKMAATILKQGLLHRRTSSTGMNRTSSRSHAVFSIFLESCKSLDNKVKKSCLHLVDLAGSERQRDAKTNEIRLKEAAMINKSLSVLSLVIGNLAKSSNSNKHMYIPYRDSKLTLLLKNAIGGNSKTTLVACVHNDEKFRAATLSTLDFANSVKMIKNTAKINIDIQGDNTSLRKEIEVLREQLENAKSPQAIQDHEFDVDLIWKERFVTAMALRSCLSGDVCSLTNQLTKSTNSTTLLEKTVAMLRDELETRDLELRYLKNKLSGVDSDIKPALDKILKKLNKGFYVLREDIDNYQLDIRVQHLSNELDKSKKLKQLALSDKTLIHSLLKDYNAIIESGDFQGEILGDKVAIANLEHELSQSEHKCSQLTRELNTISDNHRKERRELESQIASMKSQVKVADEQRKAAVANRREAFVSINNITIKRVSLDNCQRKTTMYLNAPECGDKDDSNPVVKSNDDKIIELDKITSLEDEIREFKSQVELMKFNLNEYKGEIVKLKSKLTDQEEIETRLKDMEERCNAANMDLQQSNERVQELQKEIEVLQTSRDESINSLSTRIHNLESDISTSEADRACRAEYERMSLERQNQPEESLKPDVASEDSIINSKLGEKLDGQKEEVIEGDVLDLANENPATHILALEEEIATLREEVEILREENADFRNEKPTATIENLEEEIATLREGVGILREENADFRNENEKSTATINNLGEAIETMGTKHRDQMTNMNKEYTKNREILDEQIIMLNGQLDHFKDLIKGYEADNSMLNQKLARSIPEAGVRLSCPQGGSPLRSGSVQRLDDDNTTSIKDLLDENASLNEKLDEQLAIVSSVDVVVKEVFSHLKHRIADSIVTNMETIRDMFVEIKSGYDKLVIIRSKAEKEKKDIEAMWLSKVRDAKCHGIILERKFDDFNRQMLATGHNDIKKLVKSFVEIRDENAELGAKNDRMMEDRESIRSRLAEMRVHDEATRLDYLYLSCYLNDS